MRDEIQRRIDQIPFMHKEQLLDNLLWLTGQGEQVIPQLFQALQHSEPKVRSSATWCLGWMNDKRAIPPLQELADRETDEVVRLEVARQLLVLGDLSRVSQLIAGLESDRRHVRYLCYEALKGQTGQDFGYDHRVEDASERASAVTRWRDWWTEMQSDRMLNTGRPSGSSTAQPPRMPGDTRVPPAPGDSGGQRQPPRPETLKGTPESMPSSTSQQQHHTDARRTPAQGDSEGRPSPSGSEQRPFHSAGDRAEQPSGQPQVTPAKEPATDTRPTSRPVESAEFEFK